MIGYYIHHHGRGHLTRASTLARHLREPVVALTSLPMPDPGPFHSVLRLRRDDTAATVRDPTAGGRLHWVPQHDPGLRSRMAALADWIAAARPRAIVVDVSVEITAFVRLMGIPTVVIAMPGTRVDNVHRLGYDLADLIIAAWPRELYEPAWLAPHAAKTTYVGGVSRFDDRLDTARPRRDRSDDTPLRVTVVSGAGGTSLTPAFLDSWRSALPDVEWTALGVPESAWKPDPWPDLCTSSVIVSHAGQNAVADIATAAIPAVIVPQDRPFAEQATTARILQEAGLAVVRPTWPAAPEWPALLDEARTNAGQRWARWQTRGAAERAVTAIERLLQDRVPG